MNNNQPNLDRHNYLVHACAWLLACATFPLIWVGGLVTTIDAGMAFPDWLTSDGHLMPLYPWLSSAGDKFVEHGHRLLGMAAGFLSIVLVAVTWKVESRSWVRKFSLVILAGVILQGVLGGMRVVLDERTLALVHGCTGPLFFALCVAMVVFTSRWWRDTQPPSQPKIGRNVFRLAIVCACLAYLQLVVGAVVRHSPHMTGSPFHETAAAIFQTAVYFHVVLALALLAQAIILAWRAVGSGLQRTGGLILLALLVVQLMLGGGTWLVKYGLPGWATAILGEIHFVNREADAVQTAIITSHAAVGSLVLVTAVAIALRLGRQLRVAPPRWSTRPNSLMEVAL